MHVRSAGLVLISAALAVLARMPDAWCQERLSPTDALQRAQEAESEFWRAQSSGDARADALLDDAIALWEKVLEPHPDNAEYHGQIAYLLGHKIGRAWQRGVIPGSAELKPVWHRVALHRERVLELTAGQASPRTSVMEVADAYRQAGDFEQAERFHKRIGDRLVMFRFYAQTGQSAQAEEVFRSLRGFEPRYAAATYALSSIAYELANRCGELMLRDGYNAHQRAAVYRILAQANARLRRNEQLLDCARKAVALNPNSPWGWWWLAEAYNVGGYAHGAWYASQAAVLKHELRFFTGNSDTDRLSRGQIYSNLGYLYRMPFRRPEIAVEYYRKAIPEFTGLPLDWYRCEGLYMNIIYTTVQNLHDPARAREVVKEAQARFPGFPRGEGSRKDLDEMSVNVDPADGSGQEDAAPAGTVGPRGRDRQ